MSKRVLQIAEIASLFSVAAVLTVCLLSDIEYKAFFMFVAVLLSFIPFFLSFEKKRPTAVELMPVVILAATAAVGRILFVAVPNFKPVTAIVILAGITLGSADGYICGALAAFASNIFFGQGSWTPWQMFAWGLIGFVSGKLFAVGLLKNRMITCVWGFIASLLYGLILDSWTIIGFVSPLTLKAALATYGAGISFTLIHAVSSVIFIFVLYQPWNRIIKRIKIKYLT